MKKLDNTYYFTIGLKFKNYIHHLWFKCEDNKYYCDCDYQLINGYQPIPSNLFHAILNLKQKGAYQ